jgi:hypothetical protein
MSYKAARSYFICLKVERLGFTHLKFELFRFELKLVFPHISTRLVEMYMATCYGEQTNLWPVGPLC